jgi:hypothetical protein
MKPTAQELKEVLPNISEDCVNLNTNNNATEGTTIDVQPIKRIKTYKEADWQKTVIELAHKTGWKVAHFRGAWSKDGKRFITPVAGDGAGFPDLVLSRIKDGKRRVIFAELKSDKGTLSMAQLEWLTVLKGEVWRPRDYERIVEVLK